MNILMLHDVPAEDDRPRFLTIEDCRGLTPLTLAHMAMPGAFKRNVNNRLDLGHTMTYADRLA